MSTATRKCTGCKERFPAETMIKLPAGYFHEFDCATAYAFAVSERNRAKQAIRVRKEQKAERSDLKRRKDELKPSRELKKEAQASINKYVRLRDYFDPCMTCKKTKLQIEAEQSHIRGGCWDAGHYKTRGAKPQLRFNLWNIHKQCKSCNGGGGRFSHKAATVDAQYEANLIKKIGQEKVDYLNNNNDIVKFTNDYYRRIKKIFNKKARMKQKRNDLQQGFT